jgi:hypothetical protein
MKLLKSKRGIWENLSTMGIGIVTFCTVAAVAALVLASFRSGVPKTQIDPTVSNVTPTLLDGNVSGTLGYGQAGASSIAGWIPVVIVV